MNRLLLQPEVMAQYYNCSIRSYEEWKALAEPNSMVATTYIVLGVIFFVTYSPFIVVFLKSDLLKHSCYKIMFFLGVVDMFQIPLAGFVNGYFASVGMLYCMSPVLVYISGLLAITLWFMGSTGCMLLALNRCLDMFNRNLTVKFFKGKRTYFWIGGVVAYGILTFLTCCPVLFTSKTYAQFFDPFIGMPERNGTVDLVHYPYQWGSGHNFFVFLWLTTVYGAMCIRLAIQSRKTGRTRMSNMQRQIFVNVLMICTGTEVATLIYCFMQFVPTPPWLPFVGEVAWQFSHGFVGLTYFFMNATMRREAMRIFGPTLYSPNAVGQSLTYTQPPATSEKSNSKFT